jgi:hypothetical protein
VQAMIAPRADVAQLRLEFLRRHQLHRHDLHSVLGDLPAVALDLKRSGEPSTRIGLVLLMCT